jgi:hypothetical protein
VLWRLLHRTAETSAHPGRHFAAEKKPSPLSGENSKFQILNPKFDRGIVLGAFGGLAGFFLSGLVHYNWGDSEVVMIFYFIMGLSLAINAQRS